VLAEKESVDDGCAYVSRGEPGRPGEVARRLDAACGAARLYGKDCTHLFILFVFRIHSESVNTRR
jgi:hypothetical protein